MVPYSTYTVLQVFAMSSRKKSDDRSIKVITRKDNRLTEEIIEETESEADNNDEIIPGKLSLVIVDES